MKQRSAVANYELKILCADHPIVCENPVLSEFRVPP